MSTPSADALFGGSGTKSASYDGQPPITWTGVITEVSDPRHATNFEGELRYWKDGKPVYTIPLILQTEVREDKEDDGLRSMFLDQSSRKMKAVVQAVKDATGSPKPEVGGTLTVTYTHEEDTRGRFKAKCFTATYKAPAAGPPGGGWDIPATDASAPAPSVATSAATETGLKARNPDLFQFLVSKGINAEKADAFQDDQARLLAATFS